MFKELSSEEFSLWTPQIAHQMIIALDIEKWREDLGSINRFRETPMFYRTTDYHHAKRTELVASTIGKLLQLEGVAIDTPRLGIMALHHDDHEVKTGDIPRPEKDLMTGEERRELRQHEEEAIGVLSTRYYPNPFPPYYRAIWLEMADKQTPEAQVVDVADKLEGLMESVHELLCGNEAFMPIIVRYQHLVRNLSSYSIWPILANHPSMQLSTATKAPEMSYQPHLLFGKQQEPFWYRLAV
jgi:5'-deoxynucleotidase YfbR-like HD superfamily hydrolase